MRSSFRRSAPSWRGRSGAGRSGWACVEGPRAAVEEGDEADYSACVLGLRDYVENNRFPGVVLGLSGGVDSALCAAMAVDALGPTRVHAVMLPYRFTSNESFPTPRRAPGARSALRHRPDRRTGRGDERALARIFAGRPRDFAEENIQSRARGLILMAISNKSGAMVVTTGNKSEMSVGYATLYGDMNGGFNPIKDLYKMEVFRLSALRNRWKPFGAFGPDGEVIPQNILVKPPSAELRENQKDEDSLPPYPVLDGILHGLVEKEMRLADLVAEATIRRPCARSSGSCTSPSTSVANRPQGSRSAPRTSAATAVTRSSTGSAIWACRLAPRPDDRPARAGGHERTLRGVRAADSVWGPVGWAVVSRSCASAIRRWDGGPK